MKDTVIQITNDGMGKGDPTLQYKLIVKYLESIQMIEAQVKAGKVITL